MTTSHSQNESFASLNSIFLHTRYVSRYPIIAKSLKDVDNSSLIQMEKQPNLHNNNNATANSKTKTTLPVIIRHKSKPIHPIHKLFLCDIAFDSGENQFGAKKTTSGYFFRHVDQYFFRYSEFDSIHLNSPFLANATILFSYQTAPLLLVYKDGEESFALIQYSIRQDSLSLEPIVTFQPYSPIFDFNHSGKSAEQFEFFSKARKYNHIDSRQIQSFLSTDLNSSYILHIFLPHESILYSHHLQLNNSSSPTTYGIQSPSDDGSLKRGVPFSIKTNIINAWTRNNFLYPTFHFAPILSKSKLFCPRTNHPSLFIETKSESTTNLESITTTPNTSHTTVLLGELQINLQRISILSIHQHKIFSLFMSLISHLFANNVITQQESIYLLDLILTHLVDLLDSKSVPSISTFCSHELSQSNPKNRQIFTNSLYFFACSLYIQHEITQLSLPFFSFLQNFFPKWTPELPLFNLIFASPIQNSTHLQNHINIFQDKIGIPITSFFSYFGFAAMRLCLEIFQPIDSIVRFSLETISLFLPSIQIAFFSRIYLRSSPLSFPLLSGYIAPKLETMRTLNKNIQFTENTNSYRIHAYTPHWLFNFQGRLFQTSASLGAHLSPIVQGYFRFLPLIPTKPNTQQKNTFTEYKLSQMMVVKARMTESKEKMKLKLASNASSSSSSSFDASSSAAASGSLFLNSSSGSRNTDTSRDSLKLWDFPDIFDNQDSDSSDTDLLPWIDLDAISDRKSSIIISLRRYFRTQYSSFQGFRDADEEREALQKWHDREVELETRSQFCNAITGTIHLSIPPLLLPLPKGADPSIKNGSDSSSTLDEIKKLTLGLKYAVSPWATDINISQLNQSKKTSHTLKISDKVHSQLQTIESILSTSRLLQISPFKKSTSGGAWALHKPPPESKRTTAEQKAQSKEVQLRRRLYSLGLRVLASTIGRGAAGWGQNDFSSLVSHTDSLIEKKSKMFAFISQGEIDLLTTYTTPILVPPIVLAGFNASASKFSLIPWFPKSALSRIIHTVTEDAPPHGPNDPPPPPIQYEAIRVELETNKEFLEDIKQDTQVEVSWPSFSSAVSSTLSFAKLPKSRLFSLLTTGNFVQFSSSKLGAYDPYNDYHVSNSKWQMELAHGMGQTHMSEDLWNIPSLFSIPRSILLQCSGINESNNFQFLSGRGIPEKGGTSLISLNPNEMFCSNRHLRSLTSLFDGVANRLFIQQLRYNAPLGPTPTHGGILFGLGLRNILCLDRTDILSYLSQNDAFLSAGLFLGLGVQYMGALSNVPSSTVVKSTTNPFVQRKGSSNNSISSIVKIIKLHIPYHAEVNTKQQTIPLSLTNFALISLGFIALNSNNSSLLNNLILDIASRPCSIDLSFHPCYQLCAGIAFGLIFSSTTYKDGKSPIKRPEMNLPTEKNLLAGRLLRLVSGGIDIEPMGQGLGTEPLFSLVQKENPDSVLGGLKFSGLSFASGPASSNSEKAKFSDVKMNLATGYAPFSKLRFRHATWAGVSASVQESSFLDVDSFWIKTENPALAFRWEDLLINTSDTSVPALVALGLGWWRDTSDLATRICSQLLFLASNPTLQWNISLFSWISIGMINWDLIEPHSAINPTFFKTCFPLPNSSKSEIPEIPPQEYRNTVHSNLTQIGASAFILGLKFCGTFSLTALSSIIGILKHLIFVYLTSKAVGNYYPVPDIFNIQSNTTEAPRQVPGYQPPEIVDSWIHVIDFLNPDITVQDVSQLQQDLCSKIPLDTSLFRNVLAILCVSASLIASGSGTVALCRQELPFSNLVRQLNTILVHMAIDDRFDYFGLQSAIRFAIGFLFLGGGKSIISPLHTKDTCSCLFLSCWPMWDDSPSSLKTYLPPLRHLYSKCVINDFFEANIKTSTLNSPPCYKVQIYYNLSLLPESIIPHVFGIYPSQYIDTPLPHIISKEFISPCHVHFPSAIIRISLTSDTILPVSIPRFVPRLQSQSLTSVRRGFSRFVLFNSTKLDTPFQSFEFFLILSELSKTNLLYPDKLLQGVRRLLDKVTTHPSTQSFFNLLISPPIISESTNTIPDESLLLGITNSILQSFQMKSAIHAKFC